MVTPRCIVVVALDHPVGYLSKCICFVFVLHLFQNLLCICFVTNSYPKVYCCGGLRSPCRPPFQLATSLLDHIHLPANCLTLTELRALGQLLSVPLLLNIQDRLLKTIICQLLMRNKKQNLLKKLNEVSRLASRNITALQLLNQQG